MSLQLVYLLKIESLKNHLERAGVVVLVGWQAIETTPDFLIAIGAALAAALMYAIAAPYIKQNLVGVPALVIATGSQLGAALVIIPALPFTVPQQTPAAGVANLGARARCIIHRLCL